MGEGEGEGTTAEEEEGGTTEAGEGEGEETMAEEGEEGEATLEAVVEEAGVAADLGVLLPLKCLPRRPLFRPFRSSRGRGRLRSSRSRWD